MVRVAESGSEPLDLVVLAYAIGELDPRRCVVTRANQLSAGDPFGFAISDQGTAAPFTALALVAEYLRAGACRRAMLVVAEQAVVPYHVPVGTALPERDTAVALVLEPAAGRRVSALRQHASVAPSEVESLIAAELSGLPAGPARVGVIGTGGLPSGSVCTAPWWALAEELDRPGDAPRRAVLVDYDPSLGYLGVLAVDVE
jgi:4-hydroxymandelate oxidase